jgi:hypothetical protein
MSESVGPPRQRQGSERSDVFSGLTIFGPRSAMLLVRRSPDRTGVKEPAITADLKVCTTFDFLLLTFVVSCFLVWWWSPPNRRSGWTANDSYGTP